MGYEQETGGTLLSESAGMQERPSRPSKGSYEALGLMFEIGEGVRACAERSTSYYLSAAKMLSQVGQRKAACALEGGIGHVEDVQRAVYLFKMCANSGHEGAQQKTFQYYMVWNDLEFVRRQ